MKPLDLACLDCGAEDVLRSEETSFYPNKIFCPRDKEVDLDDLQASLAGIMGNREQQCQGCGIDGASRKCKSGSGACANCSCGRVG